MNPSSHLNITLIKMVIQLLISFALVLDPLCTIAMETESFKVDCRRIVFHPYCRGISAKRSNLQMSNDNELSSEDDLQQQQQQHVEQKIINIENDDDMQTKNDEADENVQTLLHNRENDFDLNDQWMKVVVQRIENRSTPPTFFTKSNIKSKNFDHQAHHAPEPLNMSHNNNRQSIYAKQAFQFKQHQQQQQQQQQPQQQAIHHGTSNILRVPKFYFHQSSFPLSYATKQQANHLKRFWNNNQILDPYYRSFSESSSNLVFNQPSSPLPPPPPPPQTHQRTRFSPLWNRYFENLNSAQAVHFNIPSQSKDGSPVWIANNHYQLSPFYRQLWSKKV